MPRRQWSSNGSALGVADFTEEKNYPFGANVFSPEVQKERLSKDTFNKLQETLADRRGARHRRSPTRSPTR